jgi:hypothetical protein
LVLDKVGNVVNIITDHKELFGALHCTLTVYIILYLVLGIKIRKSDLHLRMLVAFPVKALAVKYWYNINIK